MKQYDFSGVEEIDGVTEEELTSLLYDYKSLIKCVKDVKSYEFNDDFTLLTAEVTHGIPPVQHKFNYEVTFVYAVTHRMKIRGVGKSSVGTIAIDAEVSVKGNTIKWSIIAQLTGLMQTMLPVMISKYSENLINDFFDKFVELL